MNTTQKEKAAGENSGLFGTPNQTGNEMKHGDLTTTAQKSGNPHAFGKCPLCATPPSYLNIGRDHWMVCEEHRVKWLIGSNLFSDWKDENPEVWEANKATLEAFVMTTEGGAA